MLLAETIYLYFFLPLFMGVYVLLKPKRRPWLIAAANLLFITVYGLYGVLVFAADFAVLYFSAILIYNDRGKTERLARRKAVLALNAVLNIAVFVLFAHSAVLSVGFISGIKLFGAAVIPLHAVSYITDVYRGNCEAQTRVSSLAAYLSFFPSAGSGLVLKYKNFRHSFDSPQVTLDKAAVGIRCYVVGLSEYVLIASPLEKVWQGLTETRYENLRGIPMWLGLAVFYVSVSVKIMGMLDMGRGTAMLMGFPVKPCFKRCIFKGSVTDSVRKANIPLASWIKDYFYRPLSGLGGRACGCLAMLICSLAVVMWYDFGFGCAAAAILLFICFLAEQIFAERIRRMPKALRYVVSLFFIGIVCAAVSMPKLTDGRGIITAMFFNAAGTQNRFLSYLAGISIPLLLVGTVVMSSILPRFVKRMRLSWYGAALTAVELVLIIFCTAFMISG